MLLLRPIETRDLEELAGLAEQLDSMNLPSNREFLRERICYSQRSFARELAADEKGIYVFVLEDRKTGRCIGTSAVIAKHGVPAAPYYWLDVSTEERHSPSLDRHFTHTKLRLRSDVDGPTEIGGLILDPAYRGHPGKCGKALSTVRFAFIGMYPELFEREVIAEMLSPFEASGRNLLWDAFGRHFTGMDYREADHMCTRNKQFIADLFPADPVYATLFPEEVQRVIGEPNETAKAALRILEKVGFRPLNQVDPFDGGPYYGASRDSISCVRERRELVLPGYAEDSNHNDSEELRSPLALLSAEGTGGFRSTVVSLDDEGRPLVSKASREELGVCAGDRVVVTPLP